MRLVVGFLFFLTSVAIQDVAWAAVAGKVQFVSGHVDIVTASGETRSAAKGEEVHAGDTIVTGSRGSAQIKMIDNGFLSIRPGTELKVDEYRYEGKKSDSSFFSLLKGNFRALTGLIAKYNHKSWKTRTATAVLGVRGSDADIGFEPALQLTAIRTYTGGYSLTPLDGSQPALNVNAGGIGMFSPGSAPRMVTTFPFSPPAPRPQPGSQPSSRDDGPVSPNQGEVPLPVNVSGVASDPQSTPSNLGADVAQAISNLLPLPEQFTVASGSVVLSGTATAGPAPAGSGGVGSYMYLNTGANNLPTPTSGTMVVDGSAQKTATLGAAKELRAVSDVNANGSFKFDAGTAALVKSAVLQIPSLSGTGSYTASWGVWGSGYTIVDFNVSQTPVGNFYYAWADKVTTSTQLAGLAGLSFRYSMIGGAAGNETGATATGFNVSATGNFAAGATLGTVSVSGTANFANGSTGWNFSGSGNIADLINTNTGVPMTGSCTQCTTSSGKAYGQFVGTQAEGLVLGVNASDGTNSMTGTAVLKR